MSTVFKLVLSEIMVVCFTFAGFLFQMKSFNTDWAFVKTESSHSDWEKEYIKLDIPKDFDTRFLPTIVRRRCDQI